MGLTSTVGYRSLSRLLLIAESRDRYAVKGEVGGREKGAVKGRCHGVSFKLQKMRMPASVLKCGVGSGRCDCIPTRSVKSLHS